MAKIYGNTTATPFAATPKKMLTSIYTNNSPNWVEHNYGSVDPYAPGKVLYFCGAFVEGEEYTVRFEIQRKDGYDFVKALVSTKDSTDASGWISDYKTCVFNETENCFEFNFIAKRTVPSDINLMLYVGYPANSDGRNEDWSAVYGKTKILTQAQITDAIKLQGESIAENKKEIERLDEWYKSLEDHVITVDNRTVELMENWLDVDSRVFDLEKALGNIESALDGIITIQNNLIGGEG